MREAPIAVTLVLLMSAASLPVAPAQSPWLPVDPPDIREGDLVGDAWKVYDRTVGDGELLAETADLVAPRPSEGDYEEDNPPNGLGDEWESRYAQYVEGPMMQAADLDQDGLSNLKEFQWNLIPINASVGPVALLAPTLDEDAEVVFPNATDYDRDGWLDGSEVSYWNDPSNDDDLNSGARAAQTIALFDPDRKRDDDGDGHWNIHDVDSDNDGLIDGHSLHVSSSDDRYEEWATLALPQRPIFFTQASADVRLFHGEQTHGTLADHSDTDNDGVPDGDELVRWRELSSTAYRADFDGDGSANNLVDADADGDGILDGSEAMCPQSRPSSATCTHMFDSDRDGLLDGENVVLEVTDGRAELFSRSNVVYQDAANGTRVFMGEAERGTDPMTLDTDGDGLPDGWEVQYDLDPLSTTGRDGAEGDPDADGWRGDSEHVAWTNALEYAYGKPEWWDEVTYGTWWGGTIPTNPDTDADDVRDGVEVHEGTDPVGDAHARRAGPYDPMAGSVLDNDELESVDPQADQWLRTGYEESSATVTGTVDVPGLLADPEAFVEDAAHALVPEPLAEPVMETWSIAGDTAEDARACATSAILDVKKGNVTASTVDDAGTCALGTVHTAAGRLLDTLESIPDRVPAVIDGVSTEIHERVPPLQATAEPFVRPVLNALPVRVLEPGTTVLGNGEWPRGHVPLHGDGATPLESWPYAETPWPRFTAATLETLGVGNLYPTVASVDGAVGDEIHLISTLDAGLYNVLVETEDGLRHTYTLLPVGIPYPIDTDLDPETGVCAEVPGENTDVCGVDALVRIDVTADASTIAPRFTLERITDAPQRSRVSAFVQLPNSPRVMAVGADGTPEGTGASAGLPREFTLAIGTNLAEQGLRDVARELGNSALLGTLGESDVFSIDFTTTTRNPLGVLASVWEVREEDAKKYPVPGELSQIRARFASTPVAMHAEIAVEPKGNTTVTWRGTSRADVVVGATWAHAGNRTQMLLDVEGLPQRGTTFFSKQGEHVVLTHEALGTTDKMTASWDSTKNLRGSESKLRAGGNLAVTNLPGVMNVDVDPPANRVLYTASSTVGRIEYRGWSQRDGASDACLGSTIAEFVTSNELPDPLSSIPRTCTTLGLSGLAHVDIRVTDTRTDVTVERAGSVPRLVVALNGPDDVSLDVSPWPSTVDIHALVIPGLVDATVDLSEKLDYLQYGSREGAARLEISATDLPRHLSMHASGDNQTVTFEASDVVRDLAVLKTDGRDISLGNDDGIILVEEQGEVKAAALRLQNLTHVDFDADVDQGLTLSSDTNSTAPFRIRYRTDGAWVDGNLPRLPERMRVTYNKTAEAFDFRYSASERITDLAGDFTIGARTATIHVDVASLPHRIGVDATFGATTRVEAFTSDTIGRAEFALVGIDRELQDLSRFDHYVEVDALRPLELNGKNIPQFHTKVTGLDNLTAVFNETRAVLYSNASRTGDVGVRFKDDAGWLTLDASTLPKWARLEVSSDDVRWRAAPGTSLSVDAAADRRGLIGNFSVRNAPDSFNVTWVNTTDGLSAQLNHDASNLPFIHADLLIGVEEGVAPSRLMVHGEDVPATVTASFVKAEKRVRLNVTHANGTPATAGVLEVAYAQDHEDFTNAIPLMMDDTGGVVYARLRNNVAMEVFVRLPGVSSVHAWLEPPYSTNDIGITYRADAPSPFTIDVDDGDGTILRAKADALPAAFDLNLWQAPGRQDFQVTYTATDTVDSWTAELTKDGATLLLGGGLPRTLNVSHLGEVLRLKASEPTTFEVSYSDNGQNLRVPDGDVDYVIRNAGVGAPRVAARVTNLTRATAFMEDGYYSIDHAARTDMYLSLSVNETRLHGWVHDPPHNFTLKDQGGGNISWYSSHSARGLDIQRKTSDTLWHVNATTLPRQFTVNADVPSREVELKAHLDDAFGMLDFAYAGDGSGQFPKLNGDGFVLESTVPTDGGAPRQRVAARVAHVEALEASWNTSKVNLTLERAFPRGAFAGRYRSLDANLDVHLSRLPADLNLDMEGNLSALEDGVHLHVNGHGTPLGDLTLAYDGPGKEAMNLTAENLPDRVTLSARENGTKNLTLDYDAGAVKAPGATTLDLFAFTKKKLTADVNLTEVPRAFNLTRKDGNFSFTSSNGAVTGSLLLAPEGSRYRAPPFGWHGGSFSNETGNTHAFLRVDGLTKAVWKEKGVGGYDELDVDHRAASDKSFHLHFENDTVRGLMLLSNIPQSMDAWLNHTAERTSVKYAATSGVHRVTLNAWEKTQNGRSANVTLTSVPERVTVDYAKVGDDLVTKLMRNAGPRSPDVWAEIRGPGNAYLHTRLGDLPESVSFELHPHAEAGSGLCKFRASASGALALVELQKGWGTRKVNTQLRDAAQWVGLETTNPEEGVTADVRLTKFTGGQFCETGKDEFEFTFDTGGATKIRASVKDRLKELSVLAEGVPAGAYSVTRKNGFQYSGGGEIDALDFTFVDHARPDEDQEDAVMFERALAYVRLQAEGVPRAISYTTTDDSSENRILVSSGGERMDDLRLDVQLRDAQAAGDDEEDAQGVLEKIADAIAAAPRFVLDAETLRADGLQIYISDGTAPSMPGESGHRFTYKNTGEDGDIKLGIDFRDFAGGTVTVRVLDQASLFDFRLNDLQLKEGLPFHVLIEQNIHKWSGQVRLDIDRMPRILSMDATVLEIGNFPLTMSVDTSDRIEVMTLHLGDLYTTEVYGVPADVRTTLSSVVGGAFRTALGFSDSSARVDGFRFTRNYFDGNVKASFRVGESGPFTIEGDVDKALKYPGLPRLLDWKSPWGSANVYIELEAGDNGFVLGAGRLEAHSVALTTLRTGVEDAAKKAAQSGCEAAAGTVLTRLTFITDGVGYDVPRDVCEELWE